MALAMFMHGIAWLLNHLFFSGDVYAGFLIEAAFWLIVAAIAGLVAYRSFQAGAPPTPDLAIEEAKRTKETLEAGHPVSKTPDVYVSGAGEPVGRAAAGAPGRSSDQIRADIERQRHELGHSVEALADPRRRAHRLAAAGPGAPARARHRRRDRGLHDRRQDDAAPPQALDGHPNPRVRGRA